MTRHFRWFRDAAGRASAILLSAMALVACSQSAYYSEYVPSRAEVSGVERVAVAEFDGLERSGRAVSAMLAEGILNREHFRLYERADLDRILAERDFNQSGVVDPETVSELKLHGVDALIFGVVDAYSVDSQTGVTKVEVERGTGTYREVTREGEDGETETVREEITETVIIDRGYILRNGTMSVTFRMANINTGEIVALKTESAHFSKRAWQDEADTLPAKEIILDDLSREVAARFLAQIHPKWVTHRVIFEKNDAPATKTGISYAKAGLWERAYDELQSAAAAMPNTASAHYNVAIVAAVLGHYPEATTAIERAIEIDPKDKYIHWLSRLQQDELSAQF